MKSSKPEETHVLDAFADFLIDSGKYETLVSDITLLRYLAELPHGESTRLRIKQLGTKLTLQHDGEGAQGTIILPHVSFRLQSALLDFIAPHGSVKRQLLREPILAHAPPIETF